MRRGYCRGRQHAAVATCGDMNRWGGSHRVEPAQLGSRAPGVGTAGHGRAVRSRAAATRLHRWRAVIAGYPYSNLKRSLKTRRWDRVPTETRPDVHNRADHDDRRRSDSCATISSAAPASVVRSTRCRVVAPCWTTSTGVSPAGRRPSAPSRTGRSVRRPRAARSCPTAPPGPASSPVNPGGRARGCPDHDELVVDGAVGDGGTPASAGTPIAPRDAGNHCDGDPGFWRTRGLPHIRGRTRTDRRPLSRTTNLPARARSIRTSLMASWAIARP